MNQTVDGGQNTGARRLRLGLTGRITLPADHLCTVPPAVDAREVLGAPPGTAAAAAAGPPVLPAAADDRGRYGISRNVGHVSYVFSGNTVDKKINKNVLSIMAVVGLIGKTECDFCRHVISTN